MVSDHCSVEGNVILDFLEKEGPISSMPGPELVTGVSVALDNIAFKNWELASQRNEWQSLNASSSYFPENILNSLSYLKAGRPKEGL